jgi:hypothetical protein
MTSKEDRWRQSIERFMREARLTPSLLKALLEREMAQRGLLDRRN